MLSTLLLVVPWLVFAVLIVTVLVAPMAGVWLAERPRITAVLLGAATLGVVAVTLHPNGASSERITCNVGVPYVNSIAAESTANIALFVPIAFLAALLWRRPAVAVLSATALSAVIELLQAVVPLIGRACDTSDWITNTIGAVLGGLTAAGALAWRRAHAARTS